MPDPQGKGKPSEEAYRYRGHDIRIVTAPAATDAATHMPAKRLFIDDMELDVMETEHEVLSHDFMFQAFGSVHELAEALVRQLGTAKIVRGYDLAMLRAGHGGHGM